MAVWANPRHWTIVQRTQHTLAASAAVCRTLCGSKERVSSPDSELDGGSAFYALAGAKWTDDLVRARAKELGTASVPEACGTAHTSGIWPPVRPVSSEEPRPCSPPLTAPTAVEVMLVTGSECVCAGKLLIFKPVTVPLLSHHVRVTQLIGAAQRAREAHGMRKVNNLWPTTCAPCPPCGGVTEP